MKICYIADANSPHSERWISYFAKKGYQIDWISLAPAPAGLPSGVNFHFIKSGRLKWFKILRHAIAIKKIVRRIKPDILHSHYAGVNGVLGAFCRVRPFVLTAWGSDVLIAAKKFPAGILIKAALKKADLITCDALHLKNEILKTGVGEEKIKIINFGVETDVFCPQPPDKELQKRLGIENYPAIISTRSLAPVYDIFTLLAAAKIVIGEIPSAKFIIGGTGPLEAELKKQTKNLQLENNVVFAGFIPHNELQKWFCSAAVYVSPALSDAGIAASTAEAMACGLPAVVSNTAENDKWIQNSQNGFLFPAKDSVRLAQILVGLIKNSELRRQIGLAGRQTIVERNDYENEMAKMEKLYKSLAEKKI